MSYSHRIVFHFTIASLEDRRGIVPIQLVRIESSVKFRTGGHRKVTALGHAVYTPGDTSRLDVGVRVAVDRAIASSGIIGSYREDVQLALDSVLREDRRRFPRSHASGYPICARYTRRVWR